MPQNYCRQANHVPLLVALPVDDTLPHDLPFQEKGGRAAAEVNAHRLGKGIESQGEQQADERLAEAANERLQRYTTKAYAEGFQDTGREAPPRQRLAMRIAEARRRAIFLPA